MQCCHWRQWVLVWFFTSQSIAMVMSGQSVHLSTIYHTYFLGKLDLAVNQYFKHILLLVTDNNASWISGRENDCRNISWAISMKVWDQGGIELATPGSAARQVSAGRHVTDSATRTTMGWTSNKQRIKCLASKAQHSASCEAQTRDPLVQRPALYHWAIVTGALTLSFMNIHDKLHPLWIIV